MQQWSVQGYRPDQMQAVDLQGASIVGARELIPESSMHEYLQNQQHQQHHLQGSVGKVALQYFTATVSSRNT